MTDCSPLCSVGTAYLSDVLNYQKDIAPYPLSMIYAGLGSGKNQFAGCLMTGNAEKGIPKKTVLLITSRKSKVIETLSDKSIDISKCIGDSATLEDIVCNTSFGLNPYTREIEDDEWGNSTILQRSVACTNAFIDVYHKHIYSPIDSATHLWNRFDVIIVDEVHSLVTDATYQPAPFATMALVKETVTRIRAARRNASLPPEERNPDILAPVCQNVIFMTGTREAVASFESIPGIHILDFMDVCLNTAPKNLHFVDSQQAEAQIKSQIKEGQRIIYFANHVTPAPELAKKYDLPLDKVMMVFSDEDRLKKMKKEHDEMEDNTSSEYTRLKNAQAYLETHSRIPPELSLFVTTSKNKEGININDPDIQHVYIESHSFTDIRQMAGRIRHGAEHAYIILDSRGHNVQELPYEHEIDHMLLSLLLSNPCDPSKPIKVNTLNSMLDKFSSKHGMPNLVNNARYPMKIDNPKHPHIMKYIASTLTKFPYVGFNFIHNRYEYYALRKTGKDFKDAEMSSFDAAVSDPHDLVETFHKYFPATKIHPLESRSQTGHRYVLELLMKRGNNIFSDEEKTALIETLDALITDSRKKKRRKTAPQPNRVLNTVGLKFKQLSKKKDHPAYHLWELIGLSNSVSIEQAS
ncbi:MAG: hypothetical protein IKB78_07995 [Clostridia bacterium]|nr:hypothetical protein [Clostridia bacterium]